MCMLRSLWFNVNNFHKLSSEEKISSQSRDSNLGLLGGKQVFFLCATQPRPLGDVWHICLTTERSQVFVSSKHYQVLPVLNKIYRSDIKTVVNLKNLQNLT